MEKALSDISTTSTLSSSNQNTSSFDSIQNTKKNGDNATAKLLQNSENLNCLEKNSMRKPFAVVFVYNGEELGDFAVTRIAEFIAHQADVSSETIKCRTYDSAEIADLVTKDVLKSNNPLELEVANAKAATKIIFDNLNPKDNLDDFKTKLFNTVIKVAGRHANEKEHSIFDAMKLLSSIDPSTIGMECRRYGLTNDILEVIKKVYSSYE